MIDLDRQMMHPLAMLFDEAADEGFLSGKIFDHLDREAAEPQVLPVKTAANLIVAALLVAKLRREMVLEKGVGLFNRPHRDRHVVEAHPDPFNHVENDSLHWKKTDQIIFR